MAELPPGGLDVAAEVGAIASGPGGSEQRGRDLLQSLRRLVPFSLGRISMPNPDVWDRHLLVSYGSQDPVTAYFESSAAVRDIQLIGVDRPHPPMCLADLPVAPHRLTGWTDYFWPAGIRDGLVVGLFSPDGRHVGIMSLLTDSAHHPTPAARDLIGALGPTIAHALDPLQSVKAAAMLVHGALAAIVLTRMGGTMPVPGLETHPLLQEGSPVLAVAAARSTAGPAYTSFLCPDGDAVGGHLRVTVMACPQRPPYHPTAVVVLGPAGDLVGLTRRELQLLGLLTEGWPDDRIATSMTISRRTVASHVEHILAKLETPNRTAAAVRCLRAGLYVPPELVAAPGTAKVRRSTVTAGGARATGRLRT